MRIITAFLVILTPLLSLSQDWVTITGVNYYTLGFVGGSSGGWEINNRQFKVNLFDNSIWFANRNIAHGFDPQGNYFYFDDTIDPAFNSNVNFSTILEFTFTPTKTYLVDKSNGVLMFDGISWTQESALLNNYHISSDVDTVWVSRSNNGSYLSILNGVSTAENMYNLSKIERIHSRKGDFWVNLSTYDGLLLKKESMSFHGYNADTIDYLLDNLNYDFKFARNTDSLFTSGGRGLSIAFNDSFIDTLTQFNTSGMPGDTIIEFEFDHENNIWALFGTSYDHITHLAHLDLLTNTWDQIYDENNSPISFGTIGRKSLETDSSGNVYVAADWNLYVLKLNNWPTWLNTIELEKKSVKVFPNPARNEIQIEAGFDTFEMVEILDFSGKVLLSIEHNLDKSIDVSDLSQGIYLIKLSNSNGDHVVKFIKE